MPATIHGHGEGIVEVGFVLVGKVSDGSAVVICAKYILLEHVEFE